MWKKVTEALALFMLTIDSSEMGREWEKSKYIRRSKTTFLLIEIIPTMLKIKQWFSAL